MASTELLEYWLISIPNQDNAERAVSILKQNIETRNGQHYALDKLPISRLKVGTLDKLIALSDDLGRVDSLGRNVVQKLHRTYGELEANTNSDQLLSVYNKSIQGYITNFLWDEGHFNPRAQLRELVEAIHQNMLKTAENLRKTSSSLSEIENELAAIQRKKTGSLMNKALSEYISHEDWIEAEYIRSALVVVPNTKRNEFEQQHEFFEDTAAHKAYYEQNDEESKHELQCRVVVPNSHKLITSDQEFTLYSVLLLKRGYKWFKYVAMKNGFAVRDFSINELDDSSDDKILHDLDRKQTALKKRLQLFCKNTFSETFANWLHLKVIRCFVESVLRFGLPVDFTISVIRPPKGNETKLLKQLEAKYSFLLDKVLQQKGKDSENEIDYSGQSNDFYPFVYIELKVEL